MSVYLFYHRFRNCVMSTKRQKRNKGKGKGKKANNSTAGKQFLNTRMITFRDVIPDRIVTTLKYLSTATLTAVASDTASRQFRANGIYDVDPALASTSVAGFVEWMAFYLAYKVLACTVECEFINLDSAPTVYNVGFENVFFTANTKNYPYFGEPNQLSKLSAGIGANPVRLRKRMTMVKLLGDVQAYTGVGFNGSVAANPISLLYVSIAQSSPNAVAIVNGSFVRCQLTFEVEFFSRKNLNA